jgi:hypothetical protein
MIFPLQSLTVESYLKIIQKKQLSNNIFERFNQFPLNITGLRGFNCGITETLSTTHSVIKELSRVQPVKEVAFDESSCFWSKIVLSVMRKRSLIEALLDSFTLDVLVTDDTRNLSQIFLVSLRARVDHLLHIVPQLIAQA